jgi:hypothetical protein
MLIQRGEWNLAIGVEWSIAGDAKELRKARKKHARSDFVVAEHERQERQKWVGFHEPVKGNVYAAALLVALVKRDAIVIYPISESQVWVCAIQDHMPVVERDCILPVETARETALGWTSMPTFLNAEIIGDENGAETFDGILEMLKQGLESRAIRKKQLSMALLRRKDATLRTAAAAAAAVAAIGVLGVGLKLYIDTQRTKANDQKTALEHAQQMLAEMQNKAKVEQERKAKIAEFQRQVEAAKKEYAVRPSPSMFWGALTAVRRSIGISVHGYRPQNYECTVQQCRLTWQGSGRFVTVADKLLLPNVEPNYSTDLTAASVFPITVEQDDLPANPEVVKTAEELRFWLHSTFAAHYQGIQFEPTQPVTLAPPAGLGIEPVVVGYVGKWHITLPGNTALIQGGELMNAISKWPVRVLTIKYGGASGVDISGEYVFVGG